MNGPKIQLSPEELELVSNAEWLLTKNSIIRKVYELFGGLAEAMQQKLHGKTDPFAAEWLQQPPKISRGEQYRGLPYVMLDYPRVFGKEDVFAIRVFFWWGHFFSVTLHLKGRYLEEYAPILQKNYALLAASHFHISIGDDEWRHDFDEDNYSPLEQKGGITPQIIPADKAFCKLSSGIPLQQWNDAAQQIWQLYQVLLYALKH